LTVYALASEWVSQRDLAKAMGVKTVAVRNWEVDGIPEPKIVGKRKFYNLPAVIKWRHERAAAGRPASQRRSTEEARTRKLEAEASLAEIELAKKRDQVVEISIAMKAFSDAMSACRSRLLSIGASVAPRIELAPDVASRKEMIDDAIIEALYEISSAAFEFSGGPAEDPESRDIEESPGEDEASAEAEPKRVGRSKSRSVSRKLRRARQMENEPG
jgi:hypothetical protein